ncbi:group II intron maturase-specific domain-containing protein [Halalkalibacter alkalisediminis]|uniref:group II intron maturase-specific domain-containing protein n=1 Tax=Halalkalibacter alkalisediminis TaxID=935616 RepID=UPI00235DD229|nr:group II intron maturase-specific domain-containing protein [Halalkalibacter alkalisediminis]
MNQVIRGWVNYFKVGYMKTVLKGIDSHTRVRLRTCIWKKWKTAKNRRKNLIKLGIDTMPTNIATKVRVQCELPTREYLQRQ